MPHGFLAAIYSPVSVVPIRLSRKAMPATAHGLLVSNTFCKMRATTLSCTTQRTAAVIKELPTPRPNVVDRKPSRRMKENARPTLPQLRCVVDEPGSESMVVDQVDVLEIPTETLRAKLKETL